MKIYFIQPLGCPFIIKYKVEWNYLFVNLSNIPQVAKMEKISADEYFYDK